MVRTTPSPTHHPWAPSVAASVVPVWRGDGAGCDGATGLARTPPMGFRTWNEFGEDVNQTLMEQVYAALADRRHTVDGRPTSLVDLGYRHAGLDDGCACSVASLAAALCAPPDGAALRYRAGMHARRLLPLRGWTTPGEHTAVS